MAFYIGTSKQAQIPVTDTTSRGSTLISDGVGGGQWAYPGNNALAPGSELRYRSIFTHGYLAGGYKGSNPWRSLNKTWHATDITYYCGEQLDRAASYLDGTWSDHNGYVHGTVDAFSGSSAHTSSYNLHTGVMRQRADGGFASNTAPFGYVGNDPKTQGLEYGGQGVGGWDMHAARDYNGAFVNQQGQVGYIFAGGVAATDKFHFPTEVMWTTTGHPAGGVQVGTGASGDGKGWAATSGSNRHSLNFSNDVWSGWSCNISDDGYNKLLSTKYGHHYGSRGGNVNATGVKFSDATGSELSTYGKVRAYGEENQEMGQDWGYTLGHYDGQQNNHTIKTTYSTDVPVTMGAATQPKGHFGQSSGACSSAAATVTAGYHL